MQVSFQDSLLDFRDKMRSSNQLAENNTDCPLELRNLVRSLSAGIDNTVAIVQASSQNDREKLMTEQGNLFANIGIDLVNFFKDIKKQDYSFGTSTLVSNVKKILPKLFSLVPHNKVFIKKDLEIEKLLNKEKFDESTQKELKSILEYMKLNIPTPLKEIAQRNELNQPALTRALERYKKDGLVGILSGGKRFIEIKHLDELEEIISNAEQDNLFGEKLLVYEALKKYSKEKNLKSTAAVYMPGMNEEERNRKMLKYILEWNRESKIKFDK